MSTNILSSSAFNLKEINETFPLKELKISKETLKKNGVSSKRNLINEITACALKLVIDDVIDNNARFNFSTPKEAYIQMSRITGDAFVKARQNGAFYEIDPYKSNMNGFMINMFFRNNKRLVKKPVYIDAERKQRIIDKTNEGFKY